MNYLRRLLAWFRKWLSGNTNSPEPQLRIIEQNVYTMVNNICLSTDMKTLYLIDDGRAVSFPLDVRSGILIGTLKGQLTAATAFELPPVVEDVPELQSGSDATNVVLRASKDKEIVRLTTGKTVWTSVFHKDRMQLSLVGATEVEIRQPNDDGPVEYKSELVSFNLQENTLNIRRIGEVLVIRCLPNKVDKD
jgi:hypothetical protein